MAIPPWDDDPADGEDAPYRRPPRVLLKAIALVLIVGLLLAFPLAYISDVVFHSAREGAMIALLELVVIVVVWAAIRASRRP
jgi:hypothetical protein